MEPLGRPRRRWEYDIKMGIQELGWEPGLNWSESEKGMGGGLL